MNKSNRSHARALLAFLLCLCAANVWAQPYPKVREIFASSAAEAGAMTPTQLKQYIASEVKAWGDAVTSVGLKID